MFTAESVTGAQVLEVRLKHKMSRQTFSRMAGLAGKSTARLNNIERKESWKDGDREAVIAVLNQLEPNFDPRYMAGGGLVLPPLQSTEASPNGAPIRPVTLIEDDDDTLDDTLISVPIVAAPIVVPTIDLPIVEPEPEIETVFDIDEGYPISNSELQTWKRCRRKWWLAWYRNLSLQTSTFVGVRSVGDRIHRALQRWYVPDGHQRVDPRDALERVIVEDWTKIDQLARERGVDEDQLGRLAAEFGQSTNLERAMVEGYVQWLEETGSDAELRVVASETALTADLEVDVNDHEDPRKDMRPVKMIGKLDVRVTRVTDNVGLFMDHKSVGDLKSPAVTLPQNEQMLHYMLLEWLNTPEGEKRCDGALYNMIKRSKRTGRATPPFYDRVEVRHNPYELAAYRRRMLGATRDIIKTVDALDRGVTHFEAVYPSPKSDCRWDCDFFAICNLFDDGSAGTEDMVKALYHETDPRGRYVDARGTEE